MLPSLQIQTLKPSPFEENLNAKKLVEIFNIQIDILPKSIRDVGKQEYKICFEEITDLILGNLNKRIKRKYRSKIMQQLFQYQ